MACDRQRNLRHGFLTCRNTSNCESHGHDCNANYYAESSPYATGFVSSFISVPSIIRKVPYMYISHRKMASGTNLCAIMIFFSIYIRIKNFRERKYLNFFYFVRLLCPQHFSSRIATRQETLRFIIILCDKC